MEDLAPAFQCVLRMKSALMSQVSLRNELRAYFDDQENEFSTRLQKWFQLYERSAPIEMQMVLFKGQSEYQKAFVQLLTQGLAGGSILEPITRLEEEIRQVSQIELDEFIAQLPFRLMIPLIVFILPALLIMVLGPITLQLLEAVG